MCSQGSLQRRIADPPPVSIILFNRCTFAWQKDGQTQYLCEIQEFWGGYQWISCFSCVRSATDRNTPVIKKVLKWAVKPLFAWMGNKWHVWFVSQYCKGAKATKHWQKPRWSVFSIYPFPFLAQRTFWNTKKTTGFTYHCRENAFLERNSNFGGLILNFLIFFKSQMVLALSLGKLAIVCRFNALNSNPSQTSDDMAP